MRYAVGLENGIEGRSLAWVLEHPGCFAYGADGEAALTAAPGAIRAYIEWVTAHEGGDWLTPGDVAIEVVDTWQGYDIDENYNVLEWSEESYSVEAWFRHDWKPLTEGDVQRGLKLLAWSRSDLLEIVAGLSDEALDVQLPGERWGIRGILGHVGGADWWYLDRLDLAFPRAQVPEDAFERIRVVRDQLVEVLPTLIGVQKVVGVDGEFWSPRKVLRRAAWHERTHVEHIGNLIKSL